MVPRNNRSPVQVGEAVDGEYSGSGEASLHPQRIIGREEIRGFAVEIHVIRPLVSEEQMRIQDIGAVRRIGADIDDESGLARSHGTDARTRAVHVHVEDRTRNARNTIRLNSQPARGGEEILRMKHVAGHGAGDFERESAFDHLGSRPTDLDEQPARHRVALHHDIPRVAGSRIETAFISCPNKLSRAIRLENLSGRGAIPVRERISDAIDAKGRTEDRGTV